MDVARRHDCLQNEAVLVSGPVCFIGELPPAVTLYKQPAVRIGHTFSYRVGFILFAAGQLLF